MIGNMVPSVHTDRHSCCLPLPVVLKSLPMLGRCAPADAWPARAELTSSCNRITSKSLATGFATTLSLRRYHGYFLLDWRSRVRRS